MKSEWSSGITSRNISSSYSGINFAIVICVLFDVYLIQHYPSGTV